MQIYKGALSNTLINELQADLQKKLNARVWSISDFVWEPSLLRGITGSCATALVAPPLADKIKGELKELLPPFSELNISFYMWARNSGISSHNDGNNNFLFGGTLYLNEKWDVDHGGLFVYRDTDGINKVIVPEFNTLVINDNKTDHLVTAVSPLASAMRSTIQIWGLK